MTSQYSNPPPFYIGGFGPPPMLYGSPIPPSGFHYSYGIPPHGTYGPVPTFLPGGFEGTLSLPLSLSVRFIISFQQLSVQSQNEACHFEMHRHTLSAPLEMI